MPRPDCQPPPDPPSDSHYRQIVASAIDYAIITCTQDGCITSWNRGAESVLGWTAQEMRGDTLHRIFTPEDVAAGEVEKELQRARDESRSMNERWHLRKEGSRFWASGETMPLLDDQGHALGFVKIMRELTPMLQTLREADRAKDVFLATLAHELRNPLAPIANGLSILQRVPGDRARVEQVSAMIGRQVQQLTRLVDDLMDVSRIATGKLEIKPEVTSLVSILGAAVEMSRPHIEAAHHQLVLAFTNEPTLVRGDPARLAQVFTNILNNAAKYTPRGGRIEVAVQTQGEELQVRVRDNGAGIEPEMLRHVFGLFTQIPQQGERHTGGLGIGLSLVDGLVRLHGGRVEARSAGPGQGSEFIVHLPRDLQPGPTVAAPARVQPRETPHPPRRVLVVDDNTDAASSVADLLAMSGSEVEVVHDGQSAVDHTASFRPDIVLLDIGLPDISGYEAARRIRRLQGVRQPTLIALTGWSQQDDKQQAEQAGFDQHWTKPVDLQRLLALSNPGA